MRHRKGYAYNHAYFSVDSVLKCAPLYAHRPTTAHIPTYQTHKDMPKYALLQPINRTTKLSIDDSTDTPHRRRCTGEPVDLSTGYSTPNHTRDMTMSMCKLEWLY